MLDIKKCSSLIYPRGHSPEQTSFTYVAGPTPSNFRVIIVLQRSHTLPSQSICIKSFVTGTLSGVTFDGQLP